MEDSIMLQLKKDFFQKVLLHVALLCVELAALVLWFFGFIKVNLFVLFFGFVVAYLIGYIAAVLAVSLAQYYAKRHYDIDDKFMRTVKTSTTVCADGDDDAN